MLEKHGYTSNMSTYHDTDYPEKFFTFDDATIYTSGGACPFQATGRIDSHDFYFRLRHGGASLDIGSHFEGYLNVNKAEYGYLDGACSDDEFKQIMNALLDGYTQVKTPVSTAYNESYNYGMVKFYRDATSLEIGGSMTGSWIEDPSVSFEMEVLDGQAILECSNGYSRQMDVNTEEYDYSQFALPSGKAKEVFNLLIADYSM